MAKKLYEESSIQAIADAIREKNGTTDTYKASEMAGAIREIEAGGEDTRVKGLIERTLTEISDDSIEYIGYYAFDHFSTLTKASFPNATEIISYGFCQCSRLANVYIPKVTEIGSNGFYYDYALIEINLPAVTNIGSYALRSCLQLEKVIIGTTNCILGSKVFDSTKIADGTGYIYVPDEAVETYKTATNWSTYADQIKGISELPQE